jgi:hypothetical protein
MSTAKNQYGTPVIGVVEIHMVRQESGKFLHLDSHFFYRDTDQSDDLWVWYRRTSTKENLIPTDRAESLANILSIFLNRTQLGEQIAIVLGTSDDHQDGPTSLCAGDVLRIFGPFCIDTRIELIAIDGESFGSRRLVRFGPLHDSAAVYIPTFTQEHIDGPITPLFLNVAMTDWHDELNQWHLWEVLYKSGDNYILFQSEIGYDDQVFVAKSPDGAPRELLESARSVEFPTEGDDRHPIDKWGRLIIEDAGRLFLPH